MWSQNLENFIKNIQTFKMECEDRRAHIQKIYSSPSFIILVIRVPQKTLYLYLGRGDHATGIFRGTRLIKREYRIRDSFLDLMRAYLDNSFIIDIVGPSDARREMKMSLLSSGIKSVFHLCYSGDQLYFILTRYSADKVESFVSYENRKVDSEATLMIETPLKERWDIVDGELPIDHEKELLQKAKRVEQGQFKKRALKAKRIESDLLKLEKAGELSLKLQTVTTLPELKKLALLYDIKFRDNHTFYSGRDYLFQKTKSYKKAHQIQLERLKQHLATIKENDLLELNLHPYKMFKINQSQSLSHVKKVVSNQLGEISFYKLPSGIKIGVGKSAKGNRDLHVLWSSAEDLFFHLDERQGAHLVVKASFETLNIEELSIIGSILRDSSSLAQTQVDLIYAKIKEGKALKGALGTYLVKKPRYITVDYFPSWKAIVSPVFTEGEFKLK